MRKKGREKACPSQSPSRGRWPRRLLAAASRGEHSPFRPRRLAAASRGEQCRTLAFSAAAACRSQPRRTLAFSAAAACRSQPRRALAFSGQCPPRRPCFAVEHSPKRHAHGISVQPRLLALPQPIRCGARGHPHAPKLGTGRYTEIRRERGWTAAPGGQETLQRSAAVTCRRAGKRSKP